MNFRTFITLCSSFAGKGQILLDTQCHIGVIAGTEVKITITRHESIAVGPGTEDLPHVILIWIVSQPKFNKKEFTSSAWLLKIPAMSGSDSLLF